MPKLQNTSLKRKIKYVKLALKNSIIIKKNYLMPAHYNWHLMQTKIAICARKNKEYESRINEILSINKCIKTHFFYANRIGECICRTIDILNDIYKDENCFHLFIPDQPIANQRLHNIFSRYIEIITEENIEFWEYVFCKYYKYIDASDYQKYRERKRNYKAPLNRNFISFNSKEINEAEEKLDEMGIKGKAFICVHARDARYLTVWQSIYKAFHSMRDCDINNTLKVAQFAIEEGLKVVRIGRDVETKLNDQRVIDYPNLFHNELMDLYLQYKAKYVVGCSSGILEIASIFATPKVRTNLEVICSGAGSLIHTIYDRFIPMKFWYKKEKRYLTFLEQMEHELRAKGDSNYYTRNNIIPEQNTAEEILAVTKELHENMEGTYVYTEEDETLYTIYKHLIDNFCEENNTYDLPSGGPIECRIGMQFLRDNETML